MQRSTLSITTAVLGAALSGAAAAEPRTFKDWALRCPEAAPCVLEQRVLLEGNDQSPLLHFALQYSTAPRTLNAIARVPLGVQLEPGLEIRIDAGSPIKLRYHHCRPEGCIVLHQLDAALTAALRRGTQALIRYRLIDGRSLDVPLSLLGISAGLHALEARRPD